jgi:ATP-dependent DNA helicase RecG
MPCMVEPGHVNASARLSPGSPIEAIDAKLAARQTGSRSKGPPAAEVLERAFEIRTVRDLLHHYPRRYIDRSRVATIGALKVGQPATVIATVKKAMKRLTRRHQTMVAITLSDGTGYLELTFFNQPWVASLYRPGTELAVSGFTTLYKGKLQLANQEVEILRGEDVETVHTGRITPVHPASDGITTRTIRELVFRALERLPRIDDPMPAEVAAHEELPDYDTAIRRIHFPQDDRQLSAASERLKFDELFTLELGVAFRKHRVEAERAGVAHALGGALTGRLLETLPFEPTGAQSRAMSSIDEAMARARPMNVLLQGDVGAGKTLVAVHAALAAIDAGHQAALMAPTEVLAGQHLRSVAALLDPLGAAAYLEVARTAGARPSPQTSLLDPEPETGRADDAGSTPSLTYALLSGAVTGKARAQVLEGVADGSVDLIVGTHALVQETVTFSDLSLAVVDEQHRFGLHQRTALKSKGGDPDVLIMTATPIPRTLALTYYGDLDVVVLDELPSGRQPVETRVVRTPAERRDAYEVVRREVGAGRQAVGRTS